MQQEIGLYRVIYVYEQFHDLCKNEFWMKKEKKIFSQKLIK